MTMRSDGPPTRRWRYYKTATGAVPVKDFLDDLDDRDRDAVRAAMRTVRDGGLRVARHLHGDLYEVRAGRAGRAWRVAFATEGGRGQVLLAVTAFEKKTPRTPPGEVALAEQRLRDWRGRARPS
jgi:phage-related protein